MLKQELLRGQIVNVDMNNLNKKINSKAVFNQRDIKTAMLLCQLSMDGALDLTDCTVSAEILKPDGKTVVQKAQIVNATSGVVALGLTEQCLSAIGEVSFELVVQTDNQILYSPKIYYMVVDNLFDVESVESTDEFPILNLLISEVQKVQKELDVLETTITTNEGVRQEKESERNLAEEQRVSTMEQMQETVNGKIQEIEETITTTTDKLSEKVSEVDTEIQRSQLSTVEQVKKVDNKIVEINERLYTIDATLETTLGVIDSNMEEISQEVSDKIQEINDKLVHVTETLQQIVSEFDSKLEYVDLELDKKIKSVDILVTNKLNDVSNQVDDKISGYDSKILEVDNKISDIDNKISEVNNTQTTLTQKVDDKISGYDSKVSEVNTLVSNITDAETSRVQAEINRTNTFNAIVAELEVSQSDIDEILGMIGGL